MSMFASMAAFALATSISPGPVNVVALGSGARHGFTASLAHVTGATAGFCLLLVLAGLGLHEAVAAWPQVTNVVRWAGVVFLLYMAWKLAADAGELDAGETAARPTMRATSRRARRICSIAATSWSRATVRGYRWWVSTT